MKFKRFLCAAICVMMMLPLAACVGGTEMPAVDSTATDTPAKID